MLIDQFMLAGESVAVVVGADACAGALVGWGEAVRHVPATQVTKIAAATRNRILATPAAALDRPEKPRSPATSETTKKTRASFSTSCPSGAC